MKRVVILLRPLLIVLAVVVALAHFSAPKVAANQSFHNNHILLPPGPIFLPAYDPVNNPFGVCAGFDVLVTPVPNLNDQILTQTTLPDGTIVQNFRGPILADATNQVTGKTARINASGPGTLTIAPDGSSVSEGHGLTGIFLGHPDQVRFGLPGFFIVSGPINEVFASDGTLTSLTFQGPLTDVCAALA